MNNKRTTIWFPAAKYGLGWGLPCAWQGWVVLIAYMALMLVAGIFINPELHLGLFIAVVSSLSIALVLVYWWKGEKPKWRWGDKE